MTWVPIFDASGGWPSDPQAVWDAGYRAIAGYVNQGSWKSFTATLRDRWIKPAHPFGFAPMYEGEGDEPSTDPGKGTAHAHAGRAGTRALFGTGSDHVSIAYAMDRDISPGNANVRRYYELVRAADTAAPIGYIESDAGLPLVAAGILAGVFEPAAYGWDKRSSVMTPATAPAGVLWTQEHNGAKAGGSGSVDIGHIRTTAPILWPTTTPSTEDDMADILVTLPANYSSPGKKIPIEDAIASLMKYNLDVRNNTLTIISLLGDSAKVETAIAAAIKTLPAGVEVTAAVLQAALIGALKEFAAPDPAPAAA